jgi:hypothetical protein
MSQGRQFSTLGIRKDTKRRFEEAKPYESLSHDEFVDVLLDRWEGRR